MQSPDNKSNPLSRAAKADCHKLLTGFFFILTGLIAFIVYIPSLKNGFVIWDDPAYVYDNPYIRSINLRFFKSIFTEVINSNWHPLTILSYALDYAIWGLDSKGYHLTNIIFHALSTSLVFMVTLELMRCHAGSKDVACPSKIIIAVTAAFLFGLHPLHVESVSWISERKDVLSAFFFILAIIFYLKYASGRTKNLYYTASLVSFMLALMSKPMAISLPLVLLILDFHPLERFKGQTKTIFFEKAPFFILGILSALLTIWSQNAGNAIVQTEVYPFAGRINIALEAYIFYLYKMVFPAGLSPFYPCPPAAELFNAVFFISLGLFLLITALCIITIRKNKAFSAVWLYYLITLAPVIGIIQIGSQSAADRYTYLPSIGPFILAGVGAAWLLKRINRRYVFFAAAVLAMTALVSALSAFTIKQERVWKDNLTLWSHVIELMPGKVFIAYYNRGNTYLNMGKFKEAEEDYGKALALHPDDRNSYVNRGIAYSELQKYEPALEDFNKAISLAPDDADIYRNRGVVFMSMKNYGEAARDFKKVIAIDAENAPAYYNLGIIYSILGDRREASFYLKKASALGLKEAGFYMKAQGLS